MSTSNTKQMDKTEYWRHLKGKGMTDEEIEKIIKAMEEKKIWQK